jgi:uncharacterized protein (TIGR02453 family)
MRSEAATQSALSKNIQKSSPVKFSGFPKAGLQFLRDLKENNDRDWFRERKPTYQETVRIPMELLILEVAAACRARGLMLYAKEKQPVMRVYRDIRFSPDKRPFNTHVGASLRRSQSKTSFGEIYIHVSPKESFLAAGFWMPERPFLHAWREAMAKDPKSFQRVLTALSKNQLALSREYALTRLPRGFDSQSDGPLADVFRFTSYIVSRPLKASEFSSAKLVDIATDFALAVKPLLEFGWKLNYAPPRDILDERS